LLQVAIPSVSCKLPTLQALPRAAEPKPLAPTLCSRQQPLLPPMLLGSAIKVRPCVCALVIVKSHRIGLSGRHGWAIGACNSTANHQLIDCLFLGNKPQRCLEAWDINPLGSTLWHHPRKDKVCIGCGKRLSIVAA